jgi:hypothetical protein
LTDADTHFLSLSQTGSHKLTRPLFRARDHTTVSVCDLRLWARSKVPLASAALVDVANSFGVKFPKCGQMNRIVSAQSE